MRAFLDALFAPFAPSASFPVAADSLEAASSLAEERAAKTEGTETNQRTNSTGKHDRTSSSRAYMHPLACSDCQTVRKPGPTAICAIAGCPRVLGRPPPRYAFVTPRYWSTFGSLRPIRCASCAKLQASAASSRAGRRARRTPSGARPCTRIVERLLERHVAHEVANFCRGHPPGATRGWRRAVGRR